MFVSAIIAAAGRGTRLGAATPKQLVTLGDRTILQRSIDIVDGHEEIDEIIVALPPELAASQPPLVSAKKPVRIVDGGARRQDSVANAFAQISSLAGVIVIHDAARPFASADLFSRVIEAAAKGGAAIAALQASDTVKEATAAPGVCVVTRTLARDSIYLAQTPQAFTRDVLEDALELGRKTPDTATDEAALAEQAGHPVRVVDGEATNIKITTPQDLEVSKALLGIRDWGLGIGSMPRIGNGYDLHRLEPGRPLIIGGVNIPHDTGLVGHSDADVLCHAVTDAILGAAAAGDIGQHFPDTDPQWKGANSIALLEGAVAIVRGAGYTVANVDAVVIAERPKLLPHIPAMRANLAKAIGVDVSAVSVKGKTNEQVDALGRNDAIAVHAVALLVQSLEPKA
ncbi:MAG TPA: 2-C-methyl-D-erythritol 4-phosphate cytidylyltransferase [Vicinamibacterales bacterium]|nr:2-C-methyl-D-erythritol 4-phosphate cytidylyltransferase [Vicinamibacterales bacterium]